VDGPSGILQEVSIEFEVRGLASENPEELMILVTLLTFYMRTFLLILN
jgi:hypothetical protein